MTAPVIHIFLREENGHGAWLIVERPTGVVYTNQTNGNACDQRHAEGALIPLPKMHDVFHAVDSLFAGTWNEYLDAEINANAFDKALNKAIGKFDVKIDRTRMAESHEAWVYVIVTAWDRNYSSLTTEGGESFPAILTWENSD